MIYQVPCEMEIYISRHRVWISSRPTSWTRRETQIFPAWKAQKPKNETAEMGTRRFAVKSPKCMFKIEEELGGGQKVVLVGFSDGKFRQPRGDGNGRPKLILQSTSVYLKRQC